MKIQKYQFFHLYSEDDTNDINLFLLY